MRPLSITSIDRAKWHEVTAAADYATVSNALFIGDAATCLQKLPANSVNTCLTSPPYWSVRNYDDHPEQMGLEERVEDYVSKLVEIYREVYRVLVEEGAAWLNIGDTYLNNVGTVNGKPPRYGWQRNKQLALVPFRVALALQEDGWWVRNAAVWHKTNAMPSSVRDRLTNTWEPVFLLTKAERYYFDLDAIRVPHTTDDMVERVRAERGLVNGKAKDKKELRKWLNSPRHRSTIDGMKEIERRPNAPDPVELAAYLREALRREGKTIHEVASLLNQPFERVRHYFRTDRIGSRLPPDETWQQLRELLNLGTEFDEAMAIELGDNVFRNHPLGRNPGDIIKSPVATATGSHFAVMPKELAIFALKATLPTGGVCLDPFMGSGTTGRVTESLGGRFVGVDVNRHYVEEYLGVIQHSYLNDTNGQ